MRLASVGHDEVRLTWWGPAESRLVQPPEMPRRLAAYSGGFPQVFTHNCDDLMHHPGAAISPAAPPGPAPLMAGWASKGVPIMNLSGTAFDGALSPTPHYYARQPGPVSQSRATGVGLARADDPAQRPCAPYVTGCPPPAAVTGAGQALRCRRGRRLPLCRCRQPFSRTVTGEAADRARPGGGEQHVMHRPQARRASRPRLRPPLCAPTCRPQGVDQASATAEAHARAVPWRGRGPRNPYAA